MSIGETLAEARRHAGLTVADVSARTRIRESLIRDIEHDEFDACGGDFYARGHIRAIAAAVGADPHRLIGEYDASHPDARPVTPEELPDWAARAPRRRARHRWLAPVAYVLCLAVIGFAAIRLTAKLGASPTSAASLGRAAAQAPAAPRSPRPSPRRTPTPRPASPAPAATPVTEVTPTSAAAFGPGGAADGDDPQDAALALSGNPATPWRTRWYTTARFGNLETGTGLLLSLGRTVTATSVTIRLGATHGADLQLRAGTSAAALPVVASASDAGGTIRLPLASHPHVRYLLIWFTQLPPDPADTYQAEVSSVTVAAA